MGTNSSDTATVISFAQMGATADLTAFNCISQQSSLKILPVVGNIVNGLQCSIDLILLVPSCILPALNKHGQILGSGNPNDITGSEGDGSAAHYLTAAQPLRSAYALKTRRPPAHPHRPWSSPINSTWHTWT